MVTLTHSCCYTKAAVLGIECPVLLQQSQKIRDANSSNCDSLGQKSVQSKSLSHELHVFSYFKFVNDEKP